MPRRHGLATLDDEHVLTITLNRPDRMNAFNQPMPTTSRAVALGTDHDDVHAIVLRPTATRVLQRRRRGELYFRPENPIFEDTRDSRSTEAEPLLQAAERRRARHRRGGRLLMAQRGRHRRRHDERQFFEPTSRSA